MTISDFCCKWRKCFENFNIHRFEDEFGRDCAGLGFVMDGGNGFREKYHTMPSEPEDLQAVIDNVDDLEVLGSLVYSYWRYLTHWCMAFNVEQSVEWFDIAFWRMAELDNIPKRT